MILEILLPISTDKRFFYKSNKKVSNPKIGNIVKVEFGRKISVGVVWKIVQKVNFNKPIKEIEEFYEDLILSTETIKSIKFLSEYTCNKESNILKFFLSGLPTSSKNLCLKKIENCDSFQKPKLELTIEQEKAIQDLYSLDKKKFDVLVLDGITGSGKTRVYMHKVIESIKDGFQSLILVPEIILTEQWVKEIEKDFGIKALVYHSSIKKSVREKIWLNMNLGYPGIVVGTRSSLCIPFKNLGLIVVDEEHDQSYKQQDKIIVNFRDFAIVRSKNSSCPIILSSATPSLETFLNYLKKKYKKINLTQRVNESSLPHISLIDMKLEKGGTFISKKLESKIIENLKSNFQTLLFINKRGYAPFVMCKNCGNTRMCPNCNFPYVLHNFSNKKKSFLLCHLCNLRESFVNRCNSCLKNDCMKFPGIGIEKIFEEVKKKFSTSKIVLLSSDFVKRKGELKRILKEIIHNKVNIIIGTQLVSKGHNFPYIKTVGILNIDNLLNDFDFRSYEKTFQQITQVSGRAGRKKFKGDVFIQTHQPNHPVLMMANENKKSKYYEWELANRKNNFQPPFCNMVSIIIESVFEKEAQFFSQKIFSSIRSKFKNISILGPVPAIIFKRNNRFRYRILLKLIKNNSKQNEIKKFISTILPTNSIKIYIDVDPISFL
ncbi:MAG: Primosomal protein N' [Alphaproteobacteria bacterium MarineAlpha8_Bin1]|nr:MAG: Primosomal protein N' [Alphaproteobacteria bacterium MarineAlpha8_Bin1]